MDESAKKLKVTGRGESTSINMGLSWEHPKSLHEIVDGLHNYEAIVFMYRYVSVGLRPTLNIPTPGVRGWDD